MLVLQRKPRETIRIRKDVEVTVLEVVGKKVRIGISAPLGVRVMRQEVVEREHAIQASNDDLDELGRR